jgi:hypothetical protein
VTSKTTPSAQITKTGSLAATMLIPSRPRYQDDGTGKYDRIRVLRDQLLVRTEISPSSLVNVIEFTPARQGWESAQFLSMIESRPTFLDLVAMPQIDMNQDTRQCRKR